VPIGIDPTDLEEDLKTYVISMGYKFGVRLGADFWAYG